MEKSDYRLTPDVLSRLSVAQQMLVFQPSGPAAAMQQAVEIANQKRAEKGLPPLPPRE